MKESSFRIFHLFQHQQTKNHFNRFKLNIYKLEFVHRMESKKLQVDNVITKVNQCLVQI